MSEQRMSDLIDLMRHGRIDRRTFFARAAALGLSAGAIFRAMDAAAQGTPAASPSAGGSDLTPENLGTAGVAHSTDTSKGEITIYSSWPMSAASEQIGGDSAESIKFAIEIFGGAAGGYKITYQALDDGVAANNGSWDGQKEAENATKVVADTKCMAYIATYNSGAALVSIPITNEAGLAQISPANTAVQLTKDSPFNEAGYPDALYKSGKRNYMRVVPSDDFQGASGANYAYTTLGKKKAYVLHDQQTYGQGLATVFADSFKKLGGEVINVEGYDPNAPEYQALVTKIAAESPDILYMGAIVNLNPAKVLQDFRTVMSDEECTFMGPDGLISDSFVQAAGDAAEGALLTFGGLPPSALEGTGATWASQMTERLGHDPDSYAVYAFDAAVVALQAIDQVGDADRAKILDAMFSTKNFRGLVGEFSFTETGDPDKATLSVSKVTDGKIVFEAPISPAQ